MTLVYDACIGRMYKQLGYDLAVGHREQLLAGAKRCLAEKGYARTTARDLVAASGTNLASIGYHFGSKEALLNAALGQAFDEWTDQLAAMAMADVSATPMERAWMCWKAWLASLEEYRALLVAFTEALAQSGRTPGMREQLARRYQHVRRHIAAMVREALGAEAEADEQTCSAI